MDDVGFIYVLRGLPGIFKIGKSRRLDKRIYQLRTQLPFPVELVFSDTTTDVDKVEAGLHTKLRQCRLNGEWFRLSDDQLQYVKDAVMYGYHIPSEH